MLSTQKQHVGMFANSVQNINFTKSLDNESSATLNSKCSFISPCGKLRKHKTLSKYIRSRDQFVVPTEIKFEVDFERLQKLLKIIIKKI